MRARRGTWPPEARKVGLPPCLALPCGYLAADRASHVYTRAARVTVLRLSARRGVLVPLDSEGCSRNRRARSVLRGPDHRQVAASLQKGHTWPCRVWPRAWTVGVPNASSCVSSV
mmetsp:Transcript_35380/g.60613  ORF Transcript_35380/g.60613 Transcript_35380/m.60613 type:complete len:115 (+) Transcript_35380:711-1055(+)